MGQHISKERQRLLDKAEAYYREWEEARAGLERSSADIGKKLALVIVIGLSLLYIFRLLNSENEEPSNSRKTVSGDQGRFFKAAGNLALPLIIKGMKNMLLGDLDNGKTKS